VKHIKGDAFYLFCLGFITEPQFFSKQNTDIT